MGCGVSSARKRSAKKHQQFLKRCAAIEAVLLNRKLVQENTIRNLVIARQKAQHPLTKEDKVIIYSLDASAKFMSTQYAIVYDVRVKLQDAVTTKDAAQLMSDMTNQTSTLLDGIENRLQRVGDNLNRFSIKKQTIKDLLDNINSEDLDEKRVAEIVKECSTADKVRLETLANRDDGDGELLEDMFEEEESDEVPLVKVDKGKEKLVE